MDVLVVGRKERGMVGPVDRRRHSPGSALPLGYGDGRARCLLMAARPFGIEPMLELRIRPGCENSLEELAAIEAEGSFMISRGDRIVERDGVAPEAIGGDPNLLFAASDQHGASQFMTQPAQGLAERGSRPCLVELRPEEGDDRVALPVLVQTREREIAEEREALRLGEYRTDFPAGGVVYLQRSQNSKRYVPIRSVRHRLLHSGCAWVTPG